MKKRMTTGEKIEMDVVKKALNRPNMTIEQFRNNEVYDLPRTAARRIDAAIRRAARDGWNAGRVYEELTYSDTNYSPEAAKNMRDAFEKKYGMKKGAKK